MRAHRLSWSSVLVAVSIAALGGAISVEALPRLADGIKIARSPDSPAQVLFNHATHVDDKNPNCTACHPTPFRILKSSRATSTPIVHARMEKGEQCGMCHNGKKAFALDEDCTFCHRDDEAER